MSNRIVVLGLTAAVMIAAVLAWSSALSQPKASEAFTGAKLIDGDLWSVGINGERQKNLTSVGDVVVRYEPSAPGVQLFGRGKNVPIEGPVFAELWSIDASGRIARETDDLVTRASMSSDGSILVYETTGYHLIVLDRLTKAKILIPGKGTQPEVSSDGSRVVFVSIRDDASDFEMPTPSAGLAVFNRRNRTNITLTQNQEDYNPFWSPNSQAIFFGSVDPADGSGAGIFRIAAGGGTSELVLGENTTGSALPFTFPSERPWFSKDGAWLYYYADTGNGLLFWNVQLADGSVSTTSVRDVFPDASGNEIIAITETGTIARYPID